MAFRATDLAELADAAQSQGYEVVSNTADDTEQVYIYDPFGNRLEFCADD